MKLPQRKTLGAPFAAYGEKAPHIQRVTLRDPGHTPFNKRAREVESTLVADFTRNAQKGWADFNITEITKSHSGVVQSRTISFVLDDDLRRQLVDFLTFTAEDAP